MSPMRMVWLLFVISCLVPAGGCNVVETEYDAVASPTAGSLACDDEHIWIGNNDGLWRLETDGRVVDFTEFGDSYGIISGFDLVDGNPAFVLMDEERIVVMDWDMEVLSAIDLPQPSDPVCLTYDNETFWYGDRFREKIQHIDMDGNLLHAVPHPSSGLLLGGLATDGRNLWAAFNIIFGVNNQGTLVYRMGMDGTVLGINWGPLTNVKSLEYHQGLLYLSCYSLADNGPMIYALNADEF
ncbi:MAG: hypothetical protein GY850_25225 [bacterium]|nr:hypothetical protein [bacterium]